MRPDAGMIWNSKVGARWSRHDTTERISEPFEKAERWAGNQGDYLHSEKPTYVFLDEIQQVKGFQKVVDSLYVKPGVDLYVTGSNAYLLSGELATLLSGR